jgi:ADP-ribose pyrophosphatase YjhB (NUDIX family)
MDNQISIKAMCIVARDGKILATKGYDAVKKEHFHRLIGGHVEFTERSLDALQREVREELGCSVESPELLTVVENTFTYNGKPGHEVIFLYSGTLSNEALYGMERIVISEPEGDHIAEWVPIQKVLEGSVRLYPAVEYAKYVT